MEMDKYRKITNPQDAGYIGEMVSPVNAYFHFPLFLQGEPIVGVI
jgi:hypothetical protein